MTATQFPELLQNAATQFIHAKKWWFQNEAWRPFLVNPSTHDHSQPENISQLNPQFGFRSLDSPIINQAAAKIQDMLSLATTIAKRVLLLVHPALPLQPQILQVILL